MDAAKWSQGFQDIGFVKAPMEDSRGPNPMLERKTKPPEQLNCPRCNSTNTKFCYYNNYSLTQPRYFCKTCRRYWTEGGSLRNVPVGGGSRKNKRSIISTSSSSSSISSASANKVPDLNPTSSFSHLSNSHQNPNHKSQDLNLAFPAMHAQEDHGNLPQYLQVMPKNELQQNHFSNSCNTSTPLSALELLRSGMASRGLNSFVPAAAPTVPDHSTSGFNIQDYKPTLSFSIDGLGVGNSRDIGVHENGGRLFFPFGDQMKPISSSTNGVDDQNKGQDNSSAGYWNNNGMLGGGSW